MNTKRVLVADDELAILSVVAYKLRNAGLGVITANDGRQALELARSEVPDLVIIDYEMPGLNGLEVCLQLRAEAGTAQMPIIMLTAREMDIAEADVKRARISLVMSKPFSPREVLANAEELLSSKSVE